MPGTGGASVVTPSIGTGDAQPDIAIRRRADSPPVRVTVLPCSRRSPVTATHRPCMR